MRIKKIPVVLSSFLGFSFLAALGYGETAKPSIIFIMADDLGLRDLGCYGQTEIKTPNIDRLAEKSIRCLNAYSGASVCAPSRCVLMTGKHLGHATVRGNGAASGGVLVPEYGNARRVGLGASDVTTAMLLKEAGYTTALVGKWGLGEIGTEGEPRWKGFDQSFGYLNQDHASNYYTDHLWLNGERYPIEKNRDGGKAVYSHDLLTDFALDFVEKNASQPFYLYLTWTIPHMDYVVPELGDYAARDWPENAKIFAAMVSRLDRDLGRLMSKLEDLKIDDDTLVIFTSDNGAQTKWSGIFESNGDYREKKGSQYDGGIRVPLLVHWPKHIPTKRDNESVIYFADFLPSLCSLAGITCPADVDGVDLSGVLRGEQSVALTDRWLYWEQYQRKGLWQTMRNRQWKGHWFRVDDRFELYDLASDPYEKNDIADEHPQLVAEIKKRMIEAHVPSPHWPDSR